MTERVHPGSLITGIVYLLVGALFLAEALGAWSFDVADLAILGPAALILVGVALVVPALAGGRRQ